MTYEEKFILIAKTNKSFQKDCDFLREKWQLNKQSVNKAFRGFSERKDMPTNYLKDLDFLVYESGLPKRFVSVLHNYLLTGKLSVRDASAPKVALYFDHKPLRNSGTIILELELDARLRDIEKEWPIIAKWQKMFTKVLGGQKISQPSRKFETILKVLKGKKAPSNIALDIMDWKKDDTKKESLRVRGSLKALRSRNKKMTMGARLSVKNRIEIENSRKNIPDDLRF